MPSADREAHKLARELNNIFQITLSAGSHLKETWPTDKVPQELEDIQEAARRGAVLVRDLQEVAQSDSAGDPSSRSRPTKC
jgi:hypothetical protein